MVTGHIGELGLDALPINSCKYCSHLMSFTFDSQCVPHWLDHRAFLSADEFVESFRTGGGEIFQKSKEPWIPKWVVSELICCWGRLQYQLRRWTQRRVEGWHSKRIPERVICRWHGRREPLLLLNKERLLLHHVHGAR